MQNNPKKIIRKFYRRSGCVRFPSKIRKKEESRQIYKKGYEVRFSLKNEEELKKIRSALEDLDFKLGKPYTKNKRIIQPVYGKKPFYRLKKILRFSKRRTIKKRASKQKITSEGKNG